MKLKITKKFKDNFEKIKLKYNGDISKGYFEWGNIKLPIKLTWGIPQEVIWLYSTSRTEDYEGSQTQIGIDKEGKLMWGYFSHCSCYGYEDYNGDYKEFEDNEDTFKMYEMNEVPKEILIILKGRIKEIGFYLNKSSAKTKKVNK